MAIFRCKMCGGDLGNNGDSVITCEYCNTKQALPKLDDEKKIGLYDRANQMRLNNEFDKAMEIYEQILNEDVTDADCYWSLVLCKYGIEYVEDYALNKRVPTINRVQYTSIFDDSNYKMALKYADSYQKEIYQEEAKIINDIQREILSISEKEKPFDVFICYKESDNSGRRTKDSVLAHELYYELTKEGFKVFFSRITLEDKLGTAYEPYIFAALNSSKVMVVLGTKAEYFNAVWVKNEWSRYLSLIRNGERKILIPAYRDMDPYDLPEEFSHLQAQDMSKLGFMQDLIRGIKKIVKSDESKNENVNDIENSVNDNISALIKRIFMFLEDEDFDSADSYCERVLDIDPENELAYLGKLMVNLGVKLREDLGNYDEDFSDNMYYKKIIRFGNNDLIDEVNGYINEINIRIENEYKEDVYQEALSLMDDDEISSYNYAIENFNKIIDYKDSKDLISECEKRINEIFEYENKVEEVVYSDEEYDIITFSKKYIIILGVILLIISIMYVMLVMHEKNKLIWKKDDIDEVVGGYEIVDDDIIFAVESLSQKEEEYYVYFYDFDNEDWRISNFIYGKIGDNKIYEVDLSNGLNKNYVSNESNRYAKDIDDLKVVGNTLIKVCNGKIVKYYEGNEIYIFNLDNNDENSEGIIFNFIG